MRANSGLNILLTQYKRQEVTSFVGDRHGIRKRGLRAISLVLDRHHVSAYSQRALDIVRQVSYLAEYIKSSNRFIILANRMDTTSKNRQQVNKRGKRQIYKASVKYFIIKIMHHSFIVKKYYALN